MSVSDFTGSDCPGSTVLSNGILRAQVALPDSARSYYSGVRFEPSAVTSVEFDGHRYFAEFQWPRRPSYHDSLSGAADEFNYPLGYDEVAAGDGFIKIGVGILRRIDVEPSSSFAEYPVIRRAEFRMTDFAPDSLTLENALEHNGYGYRLSKRFRLAGNRLEVHYRLDNTGGKAIRTIQYCHNFTLIDDVPAAPDAYRTRFLIPLKPGIKGDYSQVMLDLHTVRTTGETVFLPVYEVPTSPAYNFAEIVQTGTGRGVRISGDFKLEHVAYFSTVRTVCPEFFIPIDLAPGETLRWRRSTEFF